MCVVILLNIFTEFYMSSEMIEEVKTTANLQPTNVFLYSELRDQCERLIPVPRDIPVSHNKDSIYVA